MEPVLEHLSTGCLSSLKQGQSNGMKYVAVIKNLESVLIETKIFQQDLKKSGSQQ